MSRERDPILDKKTLDDAASAAAILKTLLDDDDVTIFTREQAKALIEVAEGWNKIKGALAVGRAIGGGLKWFAAFAAAWIAFKAGIYDFVKTAASH